MSYGQSGLILGCLIERGNPAGTSMFAPLMDQQKDTYGRYPRQVTADGGFASEANSCNPPLPPICLFKVRTSAPAAKIYSL